LKLIYIAIALAAGFPGLLPAEGEAPFKVGERLEFKVYFEFVLGGDAVMAVASIDTINGHPCWQILSTARSTPTVDMFYKVRDSIQSWRDLRGFSRRYRKVLNEGKYHDNKRVEYFPEDSCALIFRKSQLPPDTVKVVGAVQDVMSALYDVRTRSLEVGKSVWIDVHDLDKRYNLEVCVRRRECVEVPAGKFDCWVVEPLLQSSGIFRREGNIQVWLTADDRRMPVMMQSKLYFGRVYAKLVKYRLGK